MSRVDNSLVRYVEQRLSLFLPSVGWSWLRFAEAAKDGRLDPGEVVSFALRAAHRTTPPSLDAAEQCVRAWVKELANLGERGAAHRFIRAGGQAIPVYRCRDCEAEIIWAVTVNSKRMPVNATPTSVGTQILRLQNGVLVVRTLRAEERLAEGERRWTAHHATCPHAEKHRQPAPETAPLSARGGA